MIFVLVLALGCVGAFVWNHPVAALELARRLRARAEALQAARAEYRRWWTSAMRRPL